MVSRAKKVGRPYKNRLHERYGKLVVKEFAGVDIHNNVHWWCFCDCGQWTKVPQGNLGSGKTKSCGCLRGLNTKLPEGEASFNRLYNTYKQDAKYRKISFSLTKEEFREIVTKPCNYCGSEPSQEVFQKWFNGGFKYNGVDRVDNNLGYLKSNCVPACGFCNQAKKDLTVEEFLCKIKLIAVHRNL